MKKHIALLAGALLALVVSPVFGQNSYTYTAQSGVSLFTAQPATGTATSGVARLPNFSGTGALSVIESGITGSPSGCTLALAYQQNNSATAGSAVFTQAFTPANGTQVFNVTPSQLNGDNYVATYSCSSAYPTAGSLTVSFSPVEPASSDACHVSPKSSVALAITSATTTQLIPLAAGKKIYICGFAATLTGTSPTFQLEYGTGTTCGTGTTVLTGAFDPNAGSNVVAYSAGSTIASTAAGNALCAITTGSTPAAQGVLTYVQQ